MGLIGNGQASCWKGEKTRTPFEVSFFGGVVMLEKSETQAAIASLINAKMVNGKISCADARGIAEELQVPYSQVGDTCNEMKIKIAGCQLGCF